MSVQTNFVISKSRRFVCCVKNNFAVAQCIHKESCGMYLRLTVNHFIISIGSMNKLWETQYRRCKLYRRRRAGKKTHFNVLMLIFWRFSLTTVILSHSHVLWFFGNFFFIWKKSIFILFGCCLMEFWLFWDLCRFLPNLIH